MTMLIQPAIFAAQCPEGFVHQSSNLKMRNNKDGIKSMGEKIEDSV